MSNVLYLWFIWMQNGYDDVCNMGTSDSSVYRILSHLIIFQSLEAHFDISNHHMVTAAMYEGNQANKIEQENKANDDASIINVERIL